VGVTPATVRLWIQRFDKGGLAAITAEAPGRGRPLGLSPAITLAVLRLTRTHLSNGISIRNVAGLAGVSASTVWRVWNRHGVKTHSAAKDIDALIEQLISGTPDTSGQG
jgi:transposase